MIKQGKVFIVRQLISSGIVLSIFVGCFNQDFSLFLPFVFGLALYSANLVVLTLVVERLFRDAPQSSKGSKFGEKGLVFLALLKLLLIGIGLLIGLVVLQLNAIWLVAGAVAGLASTVVSSLWVTKKRLFSSRDLRY